MHLFFSSFNSHIYNILLSQVTELLIELQDFNLDKSYALYSAFAIGTEVEGYSISFLGSYEGDAGIVNNKRLGPYCCYQTFITNSSGRLNELVLITYYVLYQCPKAWNHRQHNFFVTIGSDGTKWKNTCEDNSAVEVTAGKKLHKLVDILGIFCNSCVRTPILPMVPDLWDTQNQTAMNLHIKLCLTEMYRRFTGVPCRHEVLNLWHGSWQLAWWELRRVPYWSMVVQWLWHQVQTTPTSKV
jgi:hypothetical protein